MVDWLLRKLGFTVEYVSEFGVHSARYDSTDYNSGRPIHPNMSAAPPWAVRRITRNRK